MPKPDRSLTFCKKGGEAVCLTDILALIIDEITVFSPGFAHIDINRVLVSIGFNRKAKRAYICGKLVPLRFENGETEFHRAGRIYRMPELKENGVSQLYVIYFYAPAFFNLSAFEKLKVIFHELYHINAEFNGDIRRMGKKKIAHGHSYKRFNSLFIDDVNKFYDYIQDTPAFDFLSFSMKDFTKKFKTITYRKIKLPKALPV